MGNMTSVSDDIFIQGNNETCFDAATTEALGSYVYALCDPRDRKVFYVGKAGGKEGQGNTRIFSHFDDARQAWKNNSIDMDQKTRRIIEIWSADEQVDWYIVRHGLPDENTALHVEAALIDLLNVSQNGPALNLIRGHGAYQHGILTPDMVRELGAQPVSPANEYPAIFIFPVQNAIARGEDIYEATRKAWSVSQNLRNISDAVAVGVANGIARGVFRIDSWKPHQTGGDAAQGKWEFKGSPFAKSELLDCDFSAVIARAMGYWQRGNYIVIQTVNSDDTIKFCFLRGNRDKKTPIDF